jgi:hypothetical protein
MHRWLLIFLISLSGISPIVLWGVTSGSPREPRIDNRLAKPVNVTLESTPGRLDPCQVLKITRGVGASLSTGEDDIASAAEVMGGGAVAGDKCATPVP